jgi:hypothetical protein
MKTFLRILFFIFFFVIPWGMIPCGWFYHLQKVEEAERKEALEMMFYVCSSFPVVEYGDVSRPYHKFYKQLHARTVGYLLFTLLSDEYRKYISSDKLEILKEMASIHRKLLIDEDCKCGDCKCGESMKISEYCGCEKNNHKKCECNMMPLEPVSWQLMRKRVSVTKDPCR